MQGRNRDTDVENKRMDTKGGKQGGEVGGGMNWEIRIDIYTLPQYILSGKFPREMKVWGTVLGDSS